VIVLLIESTSADGRRKIVDSIMALFRKDYSGPGELSERQQKVSGMCYDRVHDRVIATGQLGQMVAKLCKL
jgi:hypothetical protein